MTFSATDENDRVVATIQSNDFAIVDQDRVVRDFHSFTRSAYAKLDVTVLLDASESVAPKFWQEFAEVAQLIARTDCVTEESFSVLSFRDLKPVVVCDGDCRTLGAGGQLPITERGGQTPLYDSIVFAAKMLGSRSAPRSRKILIVFSDGADTISVKTLTDAVSAALENDVAIYSVDVGDSPHISHGTWILRNLAFNTGGRYFPIELGTAKVLEAILEDFHATYLVAYKLPNNATGFHTVRILPAHGLRLQFHCRRGYFYPNNPEN